MSTSLPSATPRYARTLRRMSVGCLAAVLVAAATLWWATPLHAGWRSTDHFVSSPGDARVRCEPGAESFAIAVVRALPAAISTVEQRQGRPFRRPVVVHVCATPESFAAFGGPRGAGGFVFNGRLFLSPKLLGTPDRIPRILTHELSHLHLSEPHSLIGYARTIPSWFKEGLAVVVSDGGGAENVSDDEARAALAAGRGFQPEWTGHLLFERSGRSYDLPEHLWYRECALLVQFLRDRDASAFQRLLQALDAGTTFRAALEQSYQQEPVALLAAFPASRRP